MILAGRVTFTPATTKNGELTYFVEAPLTLGRLVADGVIMKCNVELERFVGALF